MGASPDVVVDPKARILDAAAEDFMRHGFADTTVDDIADAVGATKGLQRPSSRLQLSGWKGSDWMPEPPLH